MATPEDCLQRSPARLLLCLPGAHRWTTGVRRCPGEDRRTQLQQQERTWTVSSVPGRLLPGQGNGGQRGDRLVRGTRSDSGRVGCCPPPGSALFLLHPLILVAFQRSETGPGWMVGVRPEGKLAKIPLPPRRLYPSPHTGLCIFNFPPILHLPTIKKKWGGDGRGRPLT